MRKNPTSQSGLVNPRVLLAFALGSVGVFLTMLSFAGTPPSRLTIDTGRLSGDAKTASTTSLAPAVAGSWSLVSSPNTGPTEYNTLYGVSCPSASDCWAAGYYYNGSHSQTLIEHWDGSAWSIVPSPNSSTSESNFLLGITCTSATDCWAVGHHDSGAVAIFLTLILHYDGISWSVVSSPNVVQAQDNDFRSVTCTSSVDCWAVGYYSIGNPALPGGTTIPQTLIEHWDGASWTVVNSPNSSPAENNALNSVTCASAANCWAVGNSSSQVNGNLSLIEHYDGVSWSIVSSLNPSPANNNVPLGVTCVSAADCWLAGYYENGVVQSLVEHYDGASWNLISSANTSSAQSNFPFAITCTSATDCWTAGFYYGYPGGNIYTLIDHYDGESWSVVDSPNPPPNLAGQYTDFLTAVTCSSTTDCWAVGYYFNVNGVQQTITEHYSVPPVQLNTVVSRKIHGSLTPPGDLPLTATGPATIECRSGGNSSGDQTLVFNFVNTLNAVTSITATATTSSGAQAVTATGSIGTGTQQNEYTVNLTGVPNASHLNVTLNGVTDSANNTGDISAHMDVLLGDVNSTGRTDSGDVTQVRNRTVTIPDTTDPASFRYDVNSSGRIDAGDVTATRNASVTVLP
jgi:hypothetical protein